MSDLSLDAYAQDLIADVLATAEAESATTPETFTRRALDDLEQAGSPRTPSPPTTGRTASRSADTAATTPSARSTCSSAHSASTPD